MTEELAIRTAQLSKSFGQVNALDGLDLMVPRGSVFGFLGPNGAGKTTTVRILLALLRPSHGQALVLGQSVYPGASILAKVGAS